MEASDISSSARCYFDTLHTLSSWMHQLVIGFYTQYFLNICHIVYALILPHCTYVERAIPDVTTATYRSSCNQCSLISWCRQELQVFYIYCHWGQKVIFIWFWPFIEILCEIFCSPKLVFEGNSPYINMSLTWKIEG